MFKWNHRKRGITSCSTDSATYDWLVGVKTLCLGNTATIVRSDEIEEIPVEKLPGTILAYECPDDRSISNLDPLFIRELQVAGILIKVSRSRLVRKVFKNKENVCFRMFGVIQGYYTCHVPDANDPRSKAVFRYCLGLREGGSTLSRMKKVIKICMIELGFGTLLCDYFLIFMEGGKNGE